MTAAETGVRDAVLVNLVDCWPGDWKTRLRNLHEEWPRGPKAPRLESSGAGRIFFTRWSSSGQANQVEFVAEAGSEDHLIFVPLKRWNLTYNIGRRTPIDTIVSAGDIALRGPDTTRSRGIYRGSFDVFRITLPNELVRESVEAMGARTACATPAPFGTSVVLDPVIHHLALSLLAASNSEIDLTEIYVDSVGLALAAHIAGKYQTGSSTNLRQLALPLSSRRLALVADYIEANLARDVSLAELSAAAGLSRMYFAAQFKAATGKSPHTFIIERRLASARTLLLDPKLPIHQIAAATGFRSHSHFIRTFRRLVGVSPGQWRDAMAGNHGISFPGGRRM